MLAEGLVQLRGACACAIPLCGGCHTYTDRVPVDEIDHVEQKRGRLPTCMRCVCCLAMKEGSEVARSAKPPASAGVLRAEAEGPAEGVWTCVRAGSM